VEPTTTDLGRANMDLVTQVGHLTATGLANPDPNLFADDFVFHFTNPSLPELAGDHHGVDGLVRLFEQLRGQADRDLRIRPRSLTPYGDDLVVAFATHTLSFGGAEIEVDAIVVWRVVAGRLAEAWDIPAVNTVRPVGPASDSAP
jgi:hypothetical protein